MKKFDCDPYFVVLAKLNKEHDELNVAIGNIKRCGMMREAIDEIVLTLEMATDGLNAMICDLEHCIQNRTEIDEEWFEAEFNEIVKN